MIYVPLVFNGPVEIKRFYNETPPVNSDKPGVYIWGFKQKDKFIPYYVGEIHSKTIASRLLDHKNHIESNNSMYVRLTKEYMEGANPYYSDDKFPFMTCGPHKGGKDELPKWLKENLNHFLNTIVYANNSAFLGLKYKGNATEKKQNYPIKELKELFGDEIDDYLKSNIDSMYAVYAECKLPDFWSRKKGEFYEFLETFIKCSLKGKTGSKSWRYNTYDMKRKKYCVDFRITNLNKYSDIFKPEPNEEFPGY